MKTTSIKLVMTLLIALLLHPMMDQQESGRYFPQTGCTMRGRFLSYWQQHGGLAQFGLPLTEQFYDNPDSIFKPQGLLVQHFERAVFEYQPENQPPNDVLLTLLGSQAYKQKYPDGAPNQLASRSNPYYFAATGKTLGGNFRAYWEGHGGLAVQGYPLSDEFSEVSSVDGRSYTVQYFERAVFELHPENAGTQYEVLLTPLGVQRYRSLLMRTRLYSLDASSTGEAWAGGQRGMVLHHRNGRWVITNNVRTTETVTDIAIPAPDDVWITSGSIYQWQANEWLESKAGFSIYRFDFVTRDVAWAGSLYASGVLLQYDGDKWYSRDYQMRDLPLDVDGLDRDEVWAVSRYSWYHYKTSTGAERQFVRDGEFRSISMITGAEGWIAAGGKNKLYHYDGSTWQPAASPVNQPLNSIEMLDSSTGWAVGEAGTILHYDGTSWQQQASPTTTTLNAVKMVSANEGWAVGDAGTILHYQNGVWSVYSY